MNLTLWISGQWRSWKNSSHRGRGRLFWSKINPELYRMDRQCCSSWPVNVVPPPLSKTKTKIYNTHFISSLKNFKSGPPITQFRIEIWKIKNNVSLTCYNVYHDWIRCVRWNKWHWCYQVEFKKLFILLLNPLSTRQG